MDKEKWQKLSFSQQMGNIGSEISRVIYWYEKKDKKNKENSLWRVLELIDLTTLRRPSRELFRLREVLCDLFLNENQYRVSTNFLKEYFINFALIK
ncbi:hypothetical protein KKA24_01975 [Patescibacteria group bacterium]|nr:hypothetical protein [Patescibacteria group bacterium]